MEVVCIYVQSFWGVVTVEACRRKQCVMSTMGRKLHFPAVRPFFLPCWPLPCLCEAALKRLGSPGRRVLSVLLGVRTVGRAVWGRFFLVSIQIQTALA